MNARKEGKSDNHIEFIIQDLKNNEERIKELEETVDNINVSNHNPYNYFNSTKDNDGNVTKFLI